MGKLYATVSINTGAETVPFQEKFTISERIRAVGAGEFSIHAKTET